MLREFHCKCCSRINQPKRGLCRGHWAIEGTVIPTDMPSKYEKFRGECVACHQMIGLVVGTDHLKMHESEVTWSIPSRPKMPIPRRR